VEYAFIPKTEILNYIIHFMDFRCNTVEPFASKRNCIANHSVAVCGMVSFTHEVVAVSILFR